MEWKKEAGVKGPLPSSKQSLSFQKPEGITVADVKAIVSQLIREQKGQYSATGQVSIGLAPIARFPWEVRFISDGAGGGTIRVYKGVLVDTTGGAYESRNSHIKYAGRSTAPIKIQGDSVSSPGDYDWISTVDQRDPAIAPPDGPGTQVAWPPTFIGGSNDIISANSTKDPEPQDGGVAFETRGVNLGKQGYGANGADSMPWFDFNYVPGTPIYLASKPNAQNQNEYGLFYGTTGLDLTAGWRVLVAHVTSFSLIHQYFRSDIVIGSSGVSTAPHSFKITCEVTNGNVMANVSDGHVNNVTLVDPANDWQSLGSATQQQKIYLIVRRTGLIYPSEIEWAVFGPGADPTNDEDTAHLLLGTVDVEAGVNGNDPTFTINQMATSSYNTIRIKYGPGVDDVTYLFNRV